jgi:6-phosphofructokinase
VLEVMGRTAGWIALYSGVAGGADCIAIPEMPYRPEVFCEKILARRKHGRHFTIIVVAEGARPEKPIPSREPRHIGPGTVRSGNAGQVLAEALAERLEVETRVTVLGHLQRGGSPVSYDRVLATRFGVHAAELVERGQWGRMVALRAHEITDLALSEVAGPPREVDPEHSLINAARAVGISFGC